ncbi:MAG: LCP family protein [Firmicutes bacterium]|nr:LCP family protein [Bacillota bacterium]
MQKEKRINIKRTIVWILITFCLLILGAMLYLYFLFGSVKTQAISTENSDLGITETETKQTQDIRNYVFYGIDTSEGTTSRSDAIMIVTVDTRNNKIKLSSVARDSYVDIPGYGMDKITHAYAYGGPELAIKTLNINFNLDIKYFATVNFDSMPKIIDSLGGVTVTVTDNEAAQISGISKAGTYLLNGKQALAFSRIRKIDTDFERGRRQRDVMEAIITKMLTVNKLTYPGILTKIMPEITTNMTTGQILEISYSVVANNISTIEQMRYPNSDLGEGKTINGVYYYVFDIAENKNRVLEYIYYDMRPAEEVTK